MQRSMHIPQPTVVTLALKRLAVEHPPVEQDVPRSDSYDTALTETINGLGKAELIHRRAPSKTKESVELAMLEWVSWFNHHHRLLEPIGYVPSAEANYYRQLAGQAPATA